MVILAIFMPPGKSIKPRSRKLRGDNWLNLDGRAIAEIFFHLQDYHKAEAV